VTRSYECEELFDCSMCEDWHCTCDCHVDQHLDIFYGWVDNDNDEVTA